MKRVAIAALLLGCASLPAQAAETWQGDLFVTAATAACNGPSTPGLTVGEFMRAVFRPRGVSDNGANTKLALFLARNTHHVEIAHKALTGAGNYAARWVTGSGNFLIYTGQYAAASTTPAPTDTTQTVVVAVQLKGFGGIAACNVTLRGSLGLRP